VTNSKPQIAGMHTETYFIKDFIFKVLGRVKEMKKSEKVRRPLQKKDQD